MSQHTMDRRSFVAAGTLALGALFFTGCGEQEGQPQESQQTGQPTTGTSARGLIMGIPVDPDGLDPQRTAALGTFEVTNNIYDTLLGMTTDGGLRARLAEGWVVADDGMSITFTLREGVSFSNGDPLDADAVVASFARLQEDASPKASQYAGYAFEAVDARTVQATLKELNVAALSDFAYPWAAIVDVKCADTLANQPVGTGPYALTSWNPQVNVVLDAREGYWGEAPHIPHVELRVLPDATSMASSLKKGEIDLFYSDSSDQIPQFEGVEGFRIISAPGNGVQLMAMNCANAPLDDVRVRQAVVQAVDKTALLQAVWDGRGTAIGSHYPVNFPGFVDCEGTLPYDVDAARALLAEAGCEDGFTLRMRLPEAYGMYVDAGQIAADYLGKVGIECEVEIVEWNTWLSDVYKGRDYDLTVVGHNGRLDPIALLGRYYSTSGENYTNLADDEIDALIDDYKSELDEDERMRMVADIQRRLATLAPALYLQDPDLTYIASDKVSGFNVYPMDVYEFSDVEIGA